VVDGISFDSIDEVLASWLERDFEEKEVWVVLKALNGGKALGPDGYSMLFIQACWVVLKENVMKVFREL
jgi:hypothetical protein